MNKELFIDNRKRYSERVTLSLAFERYTSYQEFELVYSGYTSTYSGNAYIIIAILKEVRLRKRENRL